MAQASKQFRAGVIAADVYMRQVSRLPIQIPAQAKPSFRERQSAQAFPPLCHHNEEHVSVFAELVDLLPDQVRAALPPAPYSSIRPVPMTPLCSIRSPSVMHQ
jgi:hypothetical protein